MSTESLSKENLKELKVDPKGPRDTILGPQISNLELNKVYNNNQRKKKTKICINKLQEQLRKKEIKQKFENRIAYGVFISVVAVLFYVST
tara:strand:- start:147 stop:416 length:270 start_codon:yes stop_codon:yes gene_type:complete